MNSVEHSITSDFTLNTDFTAVFELLLQQQHSSETQIHNSNSICTSYRSSRQMRNKSLFLRGILVSVLFRLNVQGA